MIFMKSQVVSNWYIHAFWSNDQFRWGVSEAIQSSLSNIITKVPPHHWRNGYENLQVFIVHFSNIMLVVSLSCAENGLACLAISIKARLSCFGCQSPLCCFCCYIIVALIIAQDYHNQSSKKKLKWFGSPIFFNKKNSDLKKIWSKKLRSKKN